MNCCEQCEHFLQWEEYGWPRGDCTNKEAFLFIGQLDGFEDAEKAGCPFFKHEDNFGG